MRYFEANYPRPVPKGLTIPFEDHRTWRQVHEAEKRAQKAAPVPDKEPA
jgi:hypothetical protein